MKKLLVSTLLAVFVLSFSACGGENEELNSGNGAVNQTQDDMQTKEEQKDDVSDKSADETDGVVSKETLMSHEETPAEDFLYWEDEDGNMVVDKYNGEDDIVVIPETIEGKPVVRITKYIFAQANDSSVKAVRLSDSVKEIEENAFSLNEQLEIVVCGSGLETIGDSAFLDCKNLSEIELNEGLKSIGGLAFTGCEKLNFVYVPESVNEIGVGAFGNLMSEDFVIRGKAGSTAESCAQSAGVKFEAQ